MPKQLKQHQTAQLFFIDADCEHSQLSYDGVSTLHTTAAQALLGESSSSTCFIYCVHRETIRIGPYTQVYTRNGN
jgi:uncharacterized protein YecT (DUF1311 family)